MENQAVILEKMITSLLNEKKYPSLRDILVTMNPSDIASVFGELEPDRIPLLFRLLPKEQAAETFILKYNRKTLPCICNNYQPFARFGLLYLPVPPIEDDSTNQNTQNANQKIN